LIFGPGDATAEKLPITGPKKTTQIKRASESIQPEGFDGEAALAE